MSGIEGYFLLYYKFRYLIPSIWVFPSFNE